MRVAVADRRTRKVPYSFGSYAIRLLLIVEAECFACDFYEFLEFLVSVRAGCSFHAFDGEECVAVACVLFRDVARAHELSSRFCMASVWMV